MAEEENAEEVVAEPAGGKGRKLVIAAVAFIVIAAGAFAALQFTKSDPPVDGDAAAAEKPSAQPALYASLHPPLVINLNDAAGASHFMQVTLEVMARQQDVINAVRDHTPVIRNSLILLYGSEVYEDVVTRAGKEKMLADGLAEIRRVMKEQSGLTGIEAIYFTGLIVQ